MIAVFFAVLGGLAMTGLMLYDMDRKRRRMAEALDRIEPLTKKSQNARLRTQNLRRLSLSLFFNSKLLDGLERELLELEEEHGVPPEQELKAVRHSTSTMKRLSALDERLSRVELVVEAAKPKPKPKPATAPDVGEDNGGEQSQSEHAPESGP